MIDLAAQLALSLSLLLQTLPPTARRCLMLPWWMARGRLIARKNWLEETARPRVSLEAMRKWRVNTEGRGTAPAQAPATVR